MFNPNRLISYKNYMNQHEIICMIFKDGFELTINDEKNDFNLYSRAFQREIVNAKTWNDFLDKIFIIL